MIAGVFGVALGALLAAPRFRGRDLLDVVVTAPMVLPPTVLGYYVLVLLGRESAVGQAFEAVTGSPIVFTRTGAVVAAAIGALPLITKSARAAIEEVDPRLLGAARTLGATPLRVFFTVTVPLAASGVLAGLTLGFARALGDFGITLMVAGSIPGETRTGALAIYDHVVAGRETAARNTAIVMTLLAAAALYGVNRLTRRRPRGV